MFTLTHLEWFIQDVTFYVLPGSKDAGACVEIESTDQGTSSERVPLGDIPQLVAKVRSNLLKGKRDDPSALYVLFELKHCLAG
jgi:hypothetical protein